jgi:hypothetical protein
VAPGTANGAAGVLAAAKVKGGSRDHVHAHDHAHSHDHDHGHGPAVKAHP